MQVGPEDLAIRSVRLLGFATPLLDQGSTETTVWPLTEYDRLPPEEQKADKVMKGVGPRLHNTLEAYGGNSQLPQRIGLFAVDINPDRLLDLRSSEGIQPVRLARHAWRLARVAMNGTERIVQEIHDSYGPADAVRMTLPPRSGLRQYRRGIINPPDVPPQFLLIRTPNIRMRKVGDSPAVR